MLVGVWLYVCVCNQCLTAVSVLRSAGRPWSSGSPRPPRVPGDGHRRPEGGYQLRVWGVQVDHISLPHTHTHTHKWITYHCLTHTHTSGSHITATHTHTHRHTHTHTAPVGHLYASPGSQ